MSSNTLSLLFIGNQNRPTTTKKCLL